MPFDGFQRLVARFRPQSNMIDGLPNPRRISVEGLVHLLRHRELWPDGFVWDYARHEGCAIGLAARYWKQRINDTWSLAKALGWPDGNGEVYRICLRLYADLGMLNVTPEHVADAFEQAQLRRAEKAARI